MPNEFDDSPRYLPDPYIACHSSEILHPDYRKCQRCPCKDYCDIYDLEQAIKILEPLTSKARKKK